MQVVTVVPGQAYDVSLWTKRSAQNIDCRTSIYYKNIRIGSGFELTTAYTQYVRRVTADMTASGSGYIMIDTMCNLSVLGARVFFDDITMTQV